MREFDDKTKQLVVKVKAGEIVYYHFIVTEGMFTEEELKRVEPFKSPTVKG